MILFRIFFVAVFFGTISFSTVQAAPYQAVFNYTPTSHWASTDPARGNKLVFDWTTDITTGTVGKYDLSFLSFTLYGNDVKLYRDIAILDGVVQPLGEAIRDIEDLYFEDRTIEDPNSFFQAGNRKYGFQVPGSYYFLTGYNNGKGYADLESTYYLDNVRVAGLTTLSGGHTGDKISYSKVELSAVPVPAGAWMFGAGLVGLSLLRKRKKPGSFFRIFPPGRRMPAVSS